MMIMMIMLMILLIIMVMMMMMMITTRVMKVKTFGEEIVCSKSCALTLLFNVFPRHKHKTPVSVHYSSLK